MAITTQMRTDVSQLYVALFGRAPDGEGLGYWVQQRDAGQSMTQIANTMYATTPARAYYPSFMTNGEIIASFYVNVLGRTADAEGAAYWTAKLNTSGATPGSVIAELINVVAKYTGTAPAGLTSQALFNNKVSVAQWYGEQNGTIAGATTILSTVTADAATVTAAKSGTVATGQTFTLTTGLDTIVGTSGNDTISGLASDTAAATDSFGAADTITGGLGTDTLNLTFTGVAAATTLPAASVTGVEVINVRALQSTVATVTTVTATNFAGATAFNADRATSAISFTGLLAGQSVGVTGNGVATNGAVTATYGPAVTAGVFNIAGGTTAGVLTEAGAGITSNTINSTGAANALTNVVLSGTSNVALTINAATNLTTGNITGFTGTTSTITVAGAAASVNIGTLENTTVKTVNASGLTAGGVTATLNTNTGIVFTGGAGNDIVTAGAVIVTGASVDAGAGTGDRLVITADAQLTTATAPFYKGFEVLQANTGVTADVSQLAANNTITGIRINDSASSTVAVNGLSAAQAANVAIIAANDGTGAITLGLTGATNGGQIDTVKAALTTTDATGVAQVSNLTGLTLAGVEKLELTGNGTAAATTGAVTLTTTNATALDSIKLTNAGTNSITVAAGHTAINLAVDASGSAGVTTIDASAYNVSTGALLTGGSGADTITGSIKADTIVGGAGNDTITGGLGLDTMTGGAGADTFSFVATAAQTNDPVAGNYDTITDFVVGTDKLQFTTVTDVVSAQQAAVQAAVTALVAGSTAAQIVTAMALANTTSLGVSFATFGGDTYVLYETAGASATFTVADDIFIKLTGVTTIPTFAADVVA